MKVFRAMAALVLAIVFVNCAQAGWVDVSAQFTQMHSYDAGGGSVSAYVIVGDPLYGSFSETFNVSYADTTHLSIDAAELQILARGVDEVPVDELYTVSVEGTDQGILAGNGLNAGWTASTFSGLENLMPTGNDNVVVDVTGFGNDGNHADLLMQLLTVDYTYQVWECDPEQVEPVVPAPSAILLCGLGTGIVGWVRRRK